ncbi:MAG: tyrosine--tRNA ligase [Kiritimatiellae bacterium]|nr:tyrosine--tRNA ligase [Kiritimatiellia bacterium]
MEHVIDTLKARGLFDNWTDPGVYDLLKTPQTVYCGFDPSADSLQAGNFVAIMNLCHYQRAGHKVLALVGGATGMIGDPSGKTTERKLQTAETIAHNAECIKEQLGRFIDFGSGPNAATLVNNLDWHGKFTFIDYLRDVGRYFRMGTMLNKESVRARLESPGGMSFTEFCYQTMQGYDFLHLYDSFGCRVEVGGSDQWGNITAGTDLVHYQRGVQCYGVTVPLVKDAAGKKFGKSEGNAMYLDSKKTSCYKFYQFFLRSEDAAVVRYLKAFTFLPLDEIAQLEEAVRTAPEKREAQKVLAEDVVRRVHGEEGLAQARRATQALFGGTLAGMSADELLAVFEDAPSAEIPAADAIGQPVARVAALAGLFKSQSEARRVADGGGLYLCNERVGAAEPVTEDRLADGRVFVLRAGKKNQMVVKVVR